jgi:hypothetical protein
MAFNSSHRTLTVGEQFQHTYKGKVYTMVVVKTDDGIGYSVDGTVYASPTAAAKAVVGKNQFVNGWKFWHMEKA